RTKKMKAALLLASGLGLAQLAATPAVLGLGFGDIELNSFLNQPLSATIILQDLAGLQPDEVVIELGSEAEFQAAGLERSLLLSRLRFEPEFAGNTGRIQVSSNENIN